jgi:hypothetical protein
MLRSVTKRLEVLVEAAQQREQEYTLVADTLSKGKVNEQYLNDNSTTTDSGTK